MSGKCCPNCQRGLDEGEMIYVCDKCGQDCCTSCSVNDGSEVVCDGCFEDAAARKETDAR